MIERLCCYCQKPFKRAPAAKMCWSCLYARQGDSQRAINAVYKAVKAGELPNPLSRLCVDCNAPAHFYDHRDYARSLDVVPVCHTCNLRRGPARWAA